MLSFIQVLIRTHSTVEFDINLIHVQTRHVFQYEMIKYL